MSINSTLPMTATFGRVWLAPMTGVSDLPFRQCASALGARYVATEMVACEGLVSGRPESLRRAAMGNAAGAMVIQLVGSDERLIAAASRRASEAGAQIIDINFGCPAKSVTGIACGSALMREPEKARALVRAAAEASDTPVTVKMRLGWDGATVNAPELAGMFEAVGARAITVHARTRSQFYSGHADWGAVAAVKKAVGVPVIVNGDIIDAPTALSALKASGADAVMIGRGAIGRPWLAASLESALAGVPFEAPDGDVLTEIVLDHLSRSVTFHGERLGVIVFRKHLGAYINAAGWPLAEGARRELRASLCRIVSHGELVRALESLWAAPERLAA